MKSIVKMVLSAAVTLFCVWLLPEDLCLTLIALNQFFTFFFIGAYESLNPVVAMASAFCLAEGEISLFTYISAFLNHQWLWIPDFRFVVVVTAANFVGYTFGLFMALRRRRREPNIIVLRPHTPTTTRLLLTEKQQEKR